MKGHTVDGSEILQAPVEVGSEYTTVYKVLALSKRWLALGFLPSTVLSYFIDPFPIL